MSREHKVTVDLSYMGDLVSVDVAQYGDRMDVVFGQGAVRRVVRIPFALVSDLVSAMQQNARFMERRVERLRTFANGAKP